MTVICSSVTDEETDSPRSEFPEWVAVWAQVWDKSLPPLVPPFHSLGSEWCRAGLGVQEPASGLSLGVI
jgi:hypothetical protein